jgi:hypothetical protein
MRLSSRDPLLVQWRFYIGLADAYLGRVVCGIESLHKTVEINRNWGLSQFVLAGALALAELLAEAAAVRAAAQCLVPNFTIAKYRRSDKRQPGIAGAARVLRQGAAFGGSPAGLESQDRYRSADKQTDRLSAHLTRPLRRRATFGSSLYWP